MFAVVVTLALAPFHFDVLEFTAYDWQTRIIPRPRPSGQVLLVPIQPQTLNQLGREPEAHDWMVVLTKLAAMRPLAIVSLINPAQVQGSYVDLLGFARAAEGIPFYFGENSLPRPGSFRLEPLSPPFEKIAVEPFPKTSDRQVLARDGVTRRLIVTYQNQLTLQPKLASAFNQKRTLSEYAGHFDLLDSGQLLIRFRAKGAQPTLEFGDALLKPIDPASVRGKIIVIGRDTFERTNDYVTTPHSKKILAMSQLEMQASSLDTLILNQAPRLAPDAVKYALTFLIALLTICVVLSGKPGRSFWVLGLTIGIFLFLATAIFALAGFVVPVAHPLLAVVVCYYFALPYRLIVENRRGWELSEKNRLLTEVEELKSNFMRMMSHDLKTPLARISGMADVIHEEADRLSAAQTAALKVIADSGEQLTNFIGSILSLSRIESKEVKLQTRSRDVNEIILSVTARLAHLAHAKQIEIMTELEPLFSIRLDPDLIQTVLFNLVENAIKYAADGTRVMVSSEEVNGQLVVQVADQGRGIPVEDLPNVFDRFYRAANARGSSPGNGLGLYLSRYFAELHGGTLEVESDVDKGSTFTLRLPLSFGSTQSQGVLHV